MGDTVQPPRTLKLKRQGTFKQGVDGQVNQVDLPRSPRTSKIFIRPDAEEMEKIRKNSLATETLRETESNDDTEPDKLAEMGSVHKAKAPVLKRQGTFVQHADGQAGTMALSTGTETKRRISQDRSPSLDAATVHETEMNEANEDAFDEETDKFSGETDQFPELGQVDRPARSPVLKRQGTFVQHADGQGGTVELSTGTETRRRVSAERSPALEAAIAMAMMPDVNEDDVTYSDEENEDIAPMDQMTRPTQPQKEDGLTVAQEAPPADTNLSATIIETSTEHGDGDDDAEERNQFGAMARVSPMKKAASQPNHNRKGTFIQGDNGKSSALDMRAVHAVVAPSEILDRAEAGLVPLAEDDASEYDDDDYDDGGQVEEDGGQTEAAIRMDRKETFIQSPNGTTTTLNMLADSALLVDLVTLNTIRDDDDEDEEQFENAYETVSLAQEPASQTIRLDSLNSDVGSGTEPLSSPDNPPAEYAESLARSTLEEPLPNSQLKGIFMQEEADGQIIIDSRVNQEVTGMQFTDENDGDRHGQLGKPRFEHDRTLRVNQQKRQQYLNNRKGTFAANEQGKMISVTLTNEQQSIDSLSNELHSSSLSEEADDIFLDYQQGSPSDHGDDNVVSQPEPVESAGAQSNDGAIAEMSYNEPITNDVAHDILVPSLSMAPTDDPSEEPASVPVTAALPASVAPRKRVTISCAPATFIIPAHDATLLATGKPKSAQRRHVSLTVPQDQVIRAMFDKADHQRRNRQRHLQRIEKNAGRQRQARFRVSQPLIVTSRRIVSAMANPPLDPRQKWQRPTPAERFVETYRVYYNGDPNSIAHNRSGSPSNGRRARLELRGSAVARRSTRS